MPQLIIPVVVAAAATVGAAMITSKGAKEASAKASEVQASTSITLADKQVAADEANRKRASEEQKIQDEKFAALQEKQLKIEAQRFNIETLAGILKDRKTVSDTPIIYQTPPPRVETGFLSQINNFFHNILRG